MKRMVINIDAKKQSGKPKLDTITVRQQKDSNR